MPRKTITVAKEERIISPEELLADGEEILRIIVYGSAATKKNHGQLIKVRGRTIMIPSKQCIAYGKICKPVMEAAWKGIGKNPMDFGISIDMRVWLQTWRVGDINNYQAAIADFLQDYGVIADDSWVHWHNPEGIHWLQGIDKENPRVELIISRFKHPKEEYRNSK